MQGSIQKRMGKRGISWTVMIADRMGPPRIRLHALRQTAATLMLMGGEHARIGQERLGHSSIQMTMSRYSHGTLDRQREAAEEREALLGG